MTCSRYESELALYVEGDLPASLVPDVEGHLESCPECRDLLAGLQASQEALGVLREEPLSEEALAIVRALVASAQPAQPVRFPRWRWAVATGLTTVAAAAVWLAMPTVRAPRIPAAAVHTASSQPAPASPTAAAFAKPSGREAATPSQSTPTNEASVSTIRARKPVSHDVSRPSATPSLSPEDADQLARAVVAISRITNVQDALREPLPPDPSPTPVVRLATADPDIVIYWRLDSNGGE